MGPERTRIKICGVDGVRAAEAAVDAGADAVGVVLAEGSPRRLELDAARAIIEALPPWVTPVVVVRDQPDHPGLALPHAWVQLHGHEDEAACAAAAAASARPGVWRGIPFDKAEARRWDACPHVSALLLDAARPGGGEAFDHRPLAAVRASLRTPLVLAGGLGPDSVGEAIGRVRPDVVDVSSGVESRPGVKDLGAIRAFVAAVRAADAARAHG